VKIVNTVTALRPVFMSESNPPLHEGEFYQRTLHN
jgi:hypothetical protein